MGYSLQTISVAQSSTVGRLPLSGHWPTVDRQARSLNHLQSTPEQACQALLELCLEHWRDPQCHTSLIVGTPI